MSSALPSGYIYFLLDNVKKDLDKKKDKRHFCEGGRKNAYLAFDCIHCECIVPLKRCSSFTFNI